MKIQVSNLPAMALDTKFLARLPKHIGIEVFSECGNDYYWDYIIPYIMKDRTGGFNVHGPYNGVDLADKNLDFSKVTETFISAFNLAKKYGGEHCVVHPSGHGIYEDRDEARVIATERIKVLNKIANEMGIELLVENLGSKDTLFGEENFIKYFAAVPELQFLIDMGHAHINGWNIESSFKILGDRIRSYHIHDNQGKDDSHLFVGQGSIDWNLFADCFAKYTPNATLVLEYSKATINELEEQSEKFSAFIQSALN